MDAPGINPEVKMLIGSLLGLGCCRRQAYKKGGLSLGFGNQVPNDRGPSNTPFYGEWEMGSYYGSWRIGKAGNILCASQDMSIDPSDCKNKLAEVELERIVAFDQLSDLDVRVKFRNGVFVDFLATTSYDDDLFHIFCPGNIYIQLSNGGIWRMCESDKPWPNEV